jgi:hypothetical protein
MSKAVPRHLAWAASIGFVALLAAPLAGQLVATEANVSGLENRGLAPAPALSGAIDDWGGFPGRVSAWLEDRFGFRRELIVLYLRLDEEIQTSSPRNAVKGDDGWLFGALDGALDGYLGRLPFAPGEADAWLDAAAVMQARAAAAGAAFFIVIPPEKQFVYPEQLTAYPPQLEGERRRETLVRRAPERGLVVVDPLDALIAAKSDDLLYYRTDTHWNERGGYVAYRQLAEAMRANGVAIDVVAPERLSWRVEENVRGDLYRLLPIDEGYSESVDRVVIADAASSIAHDALPELDWNGVPASRVTMEPRGKPSLLVLGDSFSGALTPYLYESFDEVAFVHHHMGEPPLWAIEPGRYDVVLLVIVERFLNRPFRPQEQRSESEIE